jgi:hypothetical protein
MELIHLQDIHTTDFIISLGRLAVALVCPLSHNKEIFNVSHFVQMILEGNVSKKENFLPALLHVYLLIVTAL